MHENINLVTSDTKLLYDIRELLFEQNELLKSVLIHEKSVVDVSVKEIENNTDDLDGLKRQELLARVKNLPNKPNKWSLLTNEELKTLIKEGGCK